MKLRFFPKLLSVLAAGTVCLGTAAAQGGDAFPSKPVKILVGFSPGGSNDVVARLIAPELAKGLGQSDPRTAPAPAATSRHRPCSVRPQTVTRC